LKGRHKAEHNYRTTHKPQIEIQTAQRFIKKHGDVALPPELVAKLADAERMRVEHAPDPRITLAVCLELQGVREYDMRDQLFPDVKRSEASDQRKARHDRVKKLFKRHPEEFERERKRIIPLSETERMDVAEKARLQIAR
jgi:hypothetical protein